MGQLSASRLVRVSRKALEAYRETALPRNATHGGASRAAAAGAFRRTNWVALIFLTKRERRSTRHTVWLKVSSAGTVSRVVARPR